MLSSARRANFHMSIFHQNPQLFVRLPVILHNQHRLVRIIHDLTVRRAAISPIVYHWTSEDNFIKILKLNALCGRKTLKKRNYMFDPNALSPCDIKNGDEDVICLSPYLVDDGVLYDKSKKAMKTNMVRLSLNIDRVSATGKFNQFFKLTDFGAPEFDYKVDISDDLSIRLRKFYIDPITVSVNLTIHFRGTARSVNLMDSLSDMKNDKHELICYGNIYMINRFCLTRIFVFLQRLEDKKLVNEFMDYMNSLNDDEIKKILVIFSQSISIFSEYNFNSILQLTDHLISGIHHVSSSRTELLSQLTAEEYRTVLSCIRDGIQPTIQLPCEYHEFVRKDDVQDGSRLFSLYGNHVLHQECGAPHTLQLRSQDFRSVPAEKFGNDYVETRPGLTAPTVFLDSAVRLTAHSG